VSERRFTFGLERVRELRVHAEDRAKGDLAAGLAERLRGESLLRAAEDRLAAAHALGRDERGVGNPLSGAALVAHQAWAERLERSRQDAEVALAHCEDVVALRRRAVAEAARAREALDRLRDRRLAEHRAAAARAEAARLDEIALRVHARGTAA
jgi:flagellar FliJ protein